MLNNQSLIKYDQVMTFYQNHMKKEKELIEENKKKKLKDVELLLRSQREEEKIVIQKFANEKADKEMEQIEKSIKEQQDNKNRDREALLTAKDFYEQKMAKFMEERNKVWAEKKQVFINKEMDKLKAKIISSATSELNKQRNIEIQRKLQQDRAIKDSKIRAQNSTTASTRT